MTLTEIGKRINAYLKQFENNPNINIMNSYDMRPYYNACACRVGRYVSVKYVSFQQGHTLTREEAERYLKWLEAGNVGTHHEALK